MGASSGTSPKMLFVILNTNEGTQGGYQILSKHCQHISLAANAAKKRFRYPITCSTRRGGSTAGTEEHLPY